MKPIVRHDAIRHWLGDRDPFDAVKGAQGRVVRSKEGRTTQRFEIDGEGFYAKSHEGIGWREVFKNLFQFRLPVTGARNEWEAIQRLHRIGVATLDAVAFDQRGSNPARQQSFIITRELLHTSKLAEFCQGWDRLHDTADRVLKWRIIREVARIARVMHQNGINHRDFYLCHFLLDLSQGNPPAADRPLRIFVVDLHRAQLRRRVPRRWLVKDVASLYFSAMNLSLTRRDFYRFIREYTGLPLRDALQTRAGFWKSVRRRARQLYLRDWKSPPREFF